MNGVSSDEQLEIDLESGNALLGKSVTGKNSSGKSITGTVDKVTVSDNIVKLNVGVDTIDLSKLSMINGLDSSALLEQYRESGNSLVNQTVTGLNAEGKLVVGKVDKLSIADGRVQLQIGNNTVNLTEVREIDPAASTTDGE
jgi:hypothetical protein